MEVLISDEDDYDGINAALDLPGPIPVTLAFDAFGKEELKRFYDWGVITPMQYQCQIQKI